MSIKLNQILLENETRDTIETVISNWARRDLDAVMELLHDDVIYELNLVGDELPFPGGALGKAQVRDVLCKILELFEFGSFVTDHMTVDGNCARCSIKIIYIHKASGERLMTRYRLVLKQRDGLIHEILEYHDAEFIRAFFRHAEIMITK